MTIPSSWVEIACDESGFSGSNLLDPRSPVLVHASTDLSVPEASDIIATLRSSSGGASEYKSGRLLRADQRPALEWFRATLRGRAHVHVVDKTAFVAARVLELFTQEPSYGAGTSLGGTTPLPCARSVATASSSRRSSTSPARRGDGGSTATRSAGSSQRSPPTCRRSERLSVARVEGVMGRLVDGDPAFPPPLEPLVPALAETLVFWSAGVRSVAVVHDEQSALTRGRVARLGTFLAEAVSPAPAPLRSFRQVDSRDDPRVQVADLLAGIARRRLGDRREPENVLQ